MTDWEPWKRRAIAYGPLTLAVAILAQRAIVGVLAKVGHPAATLDDSYIHFQYARAIAEGHPLRFQAGEPFTSGATSALWPALLAPFWLLGARGEAIVWPAWGLSFLALGGLAWEAARLTERLAGRAAAVGAGSMVIAFGGFAWSAASGMEVVPFAWVIARACRRAADFAEGEPSSRTPRRAAELVALAWGAALFRPEGALFALFVALTLAAFPRRDGWRDRLLPFAAGAALLAVPLLSVPPHRVGAEQHGRGEAPAGQPLLCGPALRPRPSRTTCACSSEGCSTATPLAPAIPRTRRSSSRAGRALRDGGARGNRRPRPPSSVAVARGAGVLLLALTMFAPCFYYTFLWNRLRYLWPFATGWLVGLACLARLAGDLAGAVRGAMAHRDAHALRRLRGDARDKLDGVLDDVAQSASGIDRQQVALGRWAKANLPADARIGVNDTGAIAYFGEQKDVRRRRPDDRRRGTLLGRGRRIAPRALRARPRGDAGEAPDALHRLPGVDGLDMVLGERAPRGHGDRREHPRGADDARLRGRLVDARDRRGALDARRGPDRRRRRRGRPRERGRPRLRAPRRARGRGGAHEGTTPDGDGDRRRGPDGRSVERFVAHLPAGAAARCIVRLEGAAGTRKCASWPTGEPIAAFDLEEADDWQERAFDVPTSAAGERTSIELRFSGGVTTFHYWFVTAGVNISG